MDGVEVSVMGCNIPLFLSLQPNISLTDASPYNWWIFSLFFPLFLHLQIHPQMGDVWNQFLTSLAAAKTEAAAGDLWRTAVEHGVVRPKDVPQYAGTLKGAAYYLWMVQGTQAVTGQKDQAAAHQGLLEGLDKLFAHYLSLLAPQQGAQAAVVLHKKNLPPPDSMPVRQLDECFLLWHMVDKWLTHFGSVLSEYDAMENEAKIIFL